MQALKVLSVLLVMPQGSGSNPDLKEDHENRDRVDSRDRYEHKDRKYEHKDRRYENKDRWESELKKEKSEYKDRTERGSYGDKHRWYEDDQYKVM